MNKRVPGRLITLIGSTLLCLFLAPLSVRGEEPTLQARPYFGAPAQFKSQEHVIAFQSDGFLLSNARYALQVEFVGANPVAPISTGSKQLNHGTPPPLAQVRYAELWEGITLVYDAPEGSILRSTYTLAPGAKLEQIRLHYNAPLAVNADGTLSTAYATGWVSETAPVAWQEIEGRRVAVPVAFVAYGEREVGFAVGAHDPQIALTIDPVMIWNTFLGGEGADDASGVVVDGSGNVYVLGTSSTRWGEGECAGCPLRPYTHASDAFVAKLNASGELMWNTFLGGRRPDSGAAIAADGNGNVYVVGTSRATWGAPVRPFTKIDDAFVTKLNTNGVLIWNTFLGGRDHNRGGAIAADKDGNVYISGYTKGTWGEGECAGCPIRPFTFSGEGWGEDAFVAKLDATGEMIWNTFLGGSSYDDGTGIVVDKNDNAYISGYSGDSWGEGECSGCPVRAYTFHRDAFVAKLDSDGVLRWNTFLGGDRRDSGEGIAMDSDGYVYVAGSSTTPWGEGECTGCPIRPYTGVDAFVAKLDSNGALTWNTFLGGMGGDYGSRIAVDENGDVYLAGASWNTWGDGECTGCPVRPYTSGGDVYVAKLAPSGALTWNTFLGGAFDDSERGIATDTGSNVYVTGSSRAMWGSPVRSFTFFLDAFVAKIPAAPSCTEKPETPLLFKPTNADLKKGPKVKLDWSDTACAITYQIVVREGSANGALAFKQAGWTNSRIQTTPLTSGVTYFWRVVAKNGFGKSKSVWHEFSVK